MSKRLLQSFLLDSSLQLKNRVVLAPMTRARCGTDQVPKPWNVTYYVQRASAGLIISEATTISPQAMGWAHSPAIYNKEHIHGWRILTDKVHEAGGKIFCQLWHMGRVTHSSYGFQPVAPSAIAAKGQGAGAYGADFKKYPCEVPRALDTSEIINVVNEYKHAAKCAIEAGFDGVEVHGANGYLIDQFLQSKSNIRTDRYGGSVEKRFIFLKEVLEAVCSVVPPTRVGVRLSPNGSFNDMGAEDNHDSFSYVIAEVCSY